EPLARGAGVEEEQRGAAGDAGGGEHPLAAELVRATERDFGDAEAERACGVVAEVLHARGHGLPVAALERAVAHAGEQQQRGGGGADPARRAVAEERSREAARTAPPARGRRDAAERQRLHRLSELASKVHRTVLQTRAVARRAGSGTARRAQTAFPAAPPAANATRTAACTAPAQPCFLRRRPRPTRGNTGPPGARRHAASIGQSSGCLVNGTLKFTNCLEVAAGVWLSERAPQRERGPPPCPDPQGLLASSTTSSRQASS